MMTTVYVGVDDLDYAMALTKNLNVLHVHEMTDMAGIELHDGQPTDVEEFLTTLQDAGVAYKEEA